MYGKSQRFSTTVSSNFPGVSRNCAARRVTSQGEIRIPTTVIPASSSANVAAIRPTKARASSSLRSAETPTYTGMTAEDMAPSPMISRSMFGIRNATKNASERSPAPSVTAMTLSRR